MELGRLALPLAVNEWMAKALAYPGIHLQALTPEIAISSTQLPGDFRRDPADQILVATARMHRVPLLTSDERIRAYAHVNTPA